jgi:DNA polymerase
MAEVGLGVPPGSGADTPDAAGLSAAGVAALLHWWKLAGVDTPTADVATSWLAPEPQLVAPEPDPAPVRQASGQQAPRPQAPREAVPVRPDPVWDSFDTLEALVAKVRADHPRAPFADGNPASGLMILGEAPSDEDLRTGRPFSGPAGQFLDRMLAAIGLDRTGCYIALLCPRKPTAGAPSPDEIAADLALTRAHIRLAAPRHILLLGANPVQALAGTSAAITRVRGSWLAVDAGPGAGGGPIPALATFNPAYLLRRPEEKARAWADLLALKHRLSQ